MTRYGGNYSEYWFDKVYGYKLDGVTPAPNWQGGYLKVQTMENGERMINYKLHTGDKSNFAFSGTGTYGGNPGFPRGIWVKDCFGWAIRINIPKIDKDLGFNLYGNTKIGTNSSQFSYPQGGTYYLVDKNAGTWEKYTLNGQFKLVGFDGWLIIPFNGFKKDLAEIQNGFTNMQVFLAGDEEKSWNNVDFYIGESVVVHDIQQFMDVNAPNTEKKIGGEAHNKITDKSIPAIMANDCTGAALGDGIHSFDNTRAVVRQITKPNETSKALAVNAAGGTFSSIRLTNDSLNYKEIPQEIEYQVLDSLGMSFYVEVPAEARERFSIGIEVLEDGTEYYNYSDKMFYYTVSDGVAKKFDGAIELAPGFKGYVIVPYENFEYNADSSDMVDGMLFSPDTIEYFAMTFDADMYPVLGEIALVFDDIMQWQDLEAFVTALLKIQGTDEFNIVEVIKTLHNDDTGLPRIMANDCTGTEEGAGIFSTDNIELSLVEIKGTNDSYINVKVGNGNSSVMFGNYAVSEDMDSEMFDRIINSKGIAFEVSVPEDAPMIVGMDFEVRENTDDYLEYFLYDADTFYYIITEDNKVYKAYGYLEFDPGFKGTVVIPFENFYYDENFSDYYDGKLNYYENIEYFGMYFSTEYYAAIGGATVSVDSITYFEGEALDYVDAIWHSQQAQ
jgi:hypothetical protein